MAHHYILCAMLVIINIVYGTPHIKGLYCQDPDTRKLYPINATWQSETFCGNYTCKLRKKNLTETEYTPIVKINITQYINKEFNNSNHDPMSTSPSEHSIIIKKIIPDRQPVFHKDINNKINELKEELKSNKTEDTDRYLTESEIKTITEMLHTIKKSDLDAIVDIYNLAQDIYKEMGITTAEKLVKDTMNNIKYDENKKIPMKNPISYWYEPIEQNNVKTKPADLKIEGTNVIPNTAQVYSYPATYFNGPLTDKDFGKLPYYYSISNFHRMASYLHNPYNSQNSPQEKPCKKQSNYIPQDYYNSITKDNLESYKRSPTTQTTLLPYPFSYVHHYNFTYPASYYYGNYPWAQLDVYNRNKNYPQPYYGAYLTKAPSTAIIANADELEGNYEDKEHEIEDATKLNVKDKKLPDWQTEPLSPKVLDEVKANMLEKSKLLKPLSLRKNVKLEKVGKVIKLDELTRNKRDVSIINDIHDDDKTESEEYEVYLEKTTCESSMEPGYFRVGNETEPYPACCPQRINS